MENTDERKPNQDETIFNKDGRISNKDAMKFLTKKFKNWYNEGSTKRLLNQDHSNDETRRLEDLELYDDPVNKKNDTY